MAGIINAANVPENTLNNNNQEQATNRAQRNNKECKELHIQWSPVNTVNDGPK